MTQNAPEIRLETPEEFHSRILAAADVEGRLPVRAEEMAGWDIYPYEIASLKMKPLLPLAEEEPARRGENPQECWCAAVQHPDQGSESAQEPGAGAWPGEGAIWHNELWKLVLMTDSTLPVFVLLVPRQHCDLPTMSGETAASFGPTAAAVSAAVEALPSVGRVQMAKYGDGGVHMHIFFFGRPARALQFRGSPLLDWAENFPDVPEEILEANGRAVAHHLQQNFGGVAL